MSSVIVKGMEMPEKCQNCNFMQYYPPDGNIWCYADNRLMKRGCFAEIDIQRPADCPLVEVKTPHGRLIEEPKKLEYGGLVHIAPLDFVGIVKYFYDQIHAQPTVIEAEEDQHED